MRSRRPDGRRFLQSPPVTLFGEKIQWVETTRYLGVSLDTRLIWSLHIDQVRRKIARRLGMQGSLLNEKRDLFFRNRVLLYKQLIQPRWITRAPHWGPLSPPCPETTGVTIQVYSPCYWCQLVRNRQIHEDLGVPLFADIRPLTSNFDSKLADVGKPLLRLLDG